MKLYKNQLKPNMPFYKQHLVKIVCGAGKHSRGKPVLKYEIPKIVKFNKYTTKVDYVDGLIYVRLDAKF